MFEVAVDGCAPPASVASEPAGCPAAAAGGGRLGVLHTYAGLDAANGGVALVGVERDRRRNGDCSGRQAHEVLDLRQHVVLAARSQALLALVEVGRAVERLAARVGCRVLLGSGLGNGPQLAGAVADGDVLEVLDARRRADHACKLGAGELQLDAGVAHDHDRHRTLVIAKRVVCSVELGD